MLPSILILVELLVSIAYRLVEQHSCYIFVRLSTHFPRDFANWKTAMKLLITVLEYSLYQFILRYYIKIFHFPWICEPFKSDIHFVLSLTPMLNQTVGTSRSVTGQRGPLIKVLTR